MGSIRQTIRDITPAERAQLDARDRHEQSFIRRLFPRRTDPKLRVMEFDLHFDRIVRHPVPDFPERIMPYSLVVTPLIHIGFERCFMKEAVITGTFPSEHVRVAFAVRPEGNDWTALDWPFAFDWIGNTLPVEENPEMPDWNSLRAIYRLSELQSALSRYEKMNEA